MKKRKCALHCRIKFDKKMKADRRAWQKIPRLSYKIGEVHRDVKKYNSKGFRIKSRLKATSLLEYLFSRRITNYLWQKQ